MRPTLCLQSGLEPAPSLVMALSRQADWQPRCPFAGVDGKWLADRQTDANDAERTLAVIASKQKTRYQGDIRGCAQIRR